MLNDIRFAASGIARRLALAAALFPALGAADPGKLLGVPAPRVGPLPVAQAFPFSATFIAPNVVVTRWDVQPGHYLYRDKLNFSLRDSDAAISRVCWPAANDKDDPFFGRLEVYEEPVEVRLLLDRKPAQELVLSAQYQGCAADAGLCYPPAQVDVVLATPSSAAPKTPVESCEQ
jgi:thiol:disulfide interchange protein DsbD